MLLFICAQLPPSRLMCYFPVQWNFDVHGCPVCLYFTRCGRLCGVMEGLIMAPEFFVFQLHLCHEYLGRHIFFYPISPSFKWRLLWFSTNFLREFSEIMCLANVLAYTFTELIHFVCFHHCFVPLLRPASKSIERNKRIFGKWMIKLLVVL